MAIDQPISARLQRPRHYVSLVLITGKNALTIDLKEKEGWVRSHSRLHFANALFRLLPKMHRYSQRRHPFVQALLVNGQLPPA